jgi:hypothetical protein
MMSCNDLAIDESAGVLRLRYRKCRTCANYVVCSVTGNLTLRIECIAPTSLHEY